MAFIALDMGDETDAAGVVFIGGIVQTLGNHQQFSTALQGLNTG
jgi:hypothetical protein